MLAMLSVLAGTFGLSSVAAAHHSFAMFDQKQKVTLKGTVAKFEWTNPHAFVIVDAVNDDSSTTRYTLECSSPNLMSHSGWKVNTLKAGDVVTVVFNPLRDGEPGGMLATVTLPGGTVMSAW